MPENPPSDGWPAAGVATERRLPAAIHLAGSRDEYDFVKYGSSNLAQDFREQSGWRDVAWMPTGVSPVQYVLQWGLFDLPRPEGASYAFPKAPWGTATEFVAQYLRTADQGWDEFNPAQTPKCPACNTANDPREATCVECGTPLERQPDGWGQGA